MERTVAFLLIQLLQPSDHEPITMLSSSPRYAQQGLALDSAQRTTVTEVYTLCRKLRPATYQQAAEPNKMGPARTTATVALQTAAGASPNQAAAPLL